MAELAGWVVAALVAVVAVLLRLLNKARLKHFAATPVTVVEAQLEAIASPAQGDLDALWDDYQGDDKEAAIAAAADAARNQR